MHFKYLKLDKNTLNPVYKNGVYLLYPLDDFIIQPNSISRVGVGFSVEFPKYYFAEATGVYNDILNFAGVIDSDYRGEYNILIFNRTDRIVEIKKDDICGIIQFIEIVKHEDVIRI